MKNRIDIARLGADARRQITLALFAHREQARLLGRKRNRPQESEAQLQDVVVTLLRGLEDADKLVFCHVPNGGFRRKSEAVRFKRLGVRAGVSDLLIWHPLGTGRGGAFCIELKSADGETSAEQDAWAERMARMNIPVHVCRSLEEVCAALRAEGISQPTAPSEEGARDEP